MCGIIGYIGKQPAGPILMSGLRRLEYRGYDSAGLALVTNSGLKVHKAQGKLNGTGSRFHHGLAQDFHGRNIPIAGNPANLEPSGIEKCDQDYDEENNVHGVLCAERT